MCLVPWLLLPMVNVTSVPVAAFFFFLCVYCEAQVCPRIYLGKKVKVFAYPDTFDRIRFLFTI